MLKPEQLFLVREPVDMRRGINALKQYDQAVIHFLILKIMSEA
ncbi:hypothetical protein [Xenorhabdus sp. PB62.4]|nr:hypothetical protein [Xenorhabdus sp. PB62.4]MBC8954989.1 cytochrome o ubiquinol oxidase [Xenorhabdus sp. PB62.4]